MIPVGARLEISREIEDKLGPESGPLWSAAHGDGAENHVNGDAVIETAGYSFSLAAAAAGLMWLRKKFKNRGKTREDFEAEKEAARINRSSAALEELLLSYIRPAREGLADPETLDELAGVLEEIEGYERAGKLTVRDEEALAEIVRSITAFTDAIAESKAAPPALESGSPEKSGFARLREQLVRQKELLS